MISYLFPKVPMKPKRQIPLINAGYGIRVSTVLQQIESYISFHRHQNKPHEIQIIVVGCGFDVTGLWSLSLANEMGIHVVEIDAPAVVTQKVAAIQPILDLRHSATLETIPTWHGVVNNNINNSNNNTNARYTICAADLQDPLSVETIFTSILDTTPTLLVSELVLTYLPRESADFLLQRFATLFRHAASGTVLYEPLGPTTKTKQTKHTFEPVRSILESYQASYGIHFNAKLHRGMAHHDKLPTTTTTNGTPGREHGPTTSGDVPPSPRFHPLGASPVEVRERLERLGYDHVNVVTAGTAASYHHHHPWNAMELFDEHAALALHLRSYVVVTAFPNASSSTSDLDHDMFRYYLCPWMVRPTGLLLRPQPIGRFLPVDHDSATDSCLWISTIRKPDERQVRDLFHQTYRDLFDEYPSIRKMVKSALRKDLGVGGGGGGSTDPSYSAVAAANDDSMLALGYQKQGGDFIVAIRTNSATIVEPAAAVSAEDTSRVRRQVVGGIGIRQCTTEECKSRSIPSNNTICYEIHRFFVDGEYRGNGIGASLLETVTSSVIQQRKRQLQRQRRRPAEINRNSDNAMSSNNDIPLLYLTATTPTILYEANQFYRQHGFTIQSTMEMGELTMNTYIKAVYTSQATIT